LTDPVLDRISEALADFNAGRRAQAREAFAAIWTELADDGDPFHCCVLSHYMADAQDDPLEELIWDLRALSAADRIARERPDIAGLSILSLYPSLHLNLADVLLRTGDLTGARAHLQQAAQSSDALADDAYGRMIRSGIARLATRLG
jgi:hypothetical protein